jgi:hypothetical protein
MIDLVSDGKNCQTVCKPGSVLFVSKEGWPFVWDVRCRTPRATYPGDGAKTRLRAETRHAAPIRSCSRCGLPCHRRYRRRGALLPHPFTLTFTKKAVCFLWHFPWGRPRRALPGTVFPWSPDFPPPARFPRCERRPSDRLALDMWRYSRLRSRNSGAGAEKGEGFRIQCTVYKRRSEMALEGGEQDRERCVRVIANPGQQ